MRSEFWTNPIPYGTDGADLVHEIEARLEAAGIQDEGHHELEYAMVFNPADRCRRRRTRQSGRGRFCRATASRSSLRARSSPRPATSPTTPSPSRWSSNPAADGSVAQLCLIECEIAVGDNEPAVVPTTVNTAHLGFILRMEEKGYVDAETGETTGTVGHIFPIFRALASDVNLPLALALWSFLAGAVLRHARGRQSGPTSASTSASARTRSSRVRWESSSASSKSSPRSDA